MRKTNYNHKIIEALFTLRDMQTGRYQMEPDEETVQRCIRWLDAMVPPKDEGEGS